MGDARVHVCSVWTRVSGEAQQHSVGLGAAGSLLVVLLWVYFSAQILLVGAEFNCVYARTFASPMHAKRDRANTDQAAGHPAGRHRDQRAVCAAVHTVAASGAKLCRCHLMEDLSMSGFSAPGGPAASGLLGILGSWLRSWSSEICQSSEDLQSEAAGPYVYPHSSVRVLVVDDNPLNLMMMSALMESKGLAPLLAADGAEAVTLAREMRFDLILMDLQMPILDGLEATAAIRRFESTCSRPAVPVVAYSLLLPGPGVLEAHGMNGSLAKPCDDQDLEDCLVRWCPFYRSAPTGSDVPYNNSRWLAANQNPGSSSASLR